jgi:hypothetical protein
MWREGATNDDGNRTSDIESVDSFAPVTAWDEPPKSNLLGEPSAARRRIAATLFGLVIGAVGALALRPLVRPDLAVPTTHAARGAIVAQPLPPPPSDAPGLHAIVTNVSYGAAPTFAVFRKPEAVSAVKRAASKLQERCLLRRSEARAPVTVTFAPSGIVARARASGSLAASPRRDCVERALEIVEVAPFSGKSRTLSLTLRFDG